MKMHSFKSLTEVNRALAEFEEDEKTFIKSIKTLLNAKGDPVFFVLTDVKGPNKANYYSPIGKYR